MFRPFQNQNFASNFFLSNLVKTELNLHVFKSIFFVEKSAQSDVFKELWVLILKGLKHPNIVLLETNSLKTLLGYATNDHLVPLLD